MKKKTYTPPLAEMVVVDGNDELLDVTIGGGSNCTDADDSLAKQSGSGFDPDDETAEVGSDASGWFDDSKSDW